MLFKHDYEKPYITTIVRAVGPSFETGVRGTLPEPAPSDTNVIWVAKNGNDANAGTEALPKLTIAGAIAALTAGKPVVHVFRNGYVGDLLFAESVVLPADRFVQVEEGEIAQIDEIDLSTNGTEINGLITSVVSNFPSPFTAEIIITNCHVISLVAELTGNEAGTQDYFLSYSSFESVSWSCETGDDPQWGIIANNCLFNDFFTNSGLNLLGGTSVNALRCLWFNNAEAFRFATQPSILLTACDFVRCGTLLKKIGFPVTAMPVSVNFCHLAVASLITNGTIALTEMNAIDPNFSSGLVNSTIAFPTYTGNINALLDLLRALSLAYAGKEIPDGNGKFFLNSFLGGAYTTPDPDEDVNPWDENTILSGQGFNKETEILFPPKSANVVFTLVNRSKQYDVNGNPRSNYDSLSKRFEFIFNTYTSAENIWKLVQIMMDRGTLAFFPRGEGESLFIDATSGTFDDSDDSFAPDTPQGLIPEHWSGWWITLDGNDYYIETNDETKLYLIDKLGLGFPVSGVYDFSVEYILVQPEMESITAVQEYYTNFLLGGQWREKESTSIDTTLALEWNGLTMAFEETEDLEENA